MKDKKSETNNRPNTEEIAQEELERMIPTGKLSVIPVATMLVNALDKKRPGFAKKVRDGQIFPKGKN